MAKGLRPLIAVVGNTGVGKSQFAVDLAKALNGEIINADAMQMYQGLDIITNKHPIDERHGITHHLLGTDPWSSQITVQDFEARATKIVDQIHAEEKLPILVGGTHYYIQSLIAKNALINKEKARDSPKPAEKFTPEQLEILNDPLKVEIELKNIDPIIASKFHPNDTRRLRRSLEVWYETGEKPSSIYESQKEGDTSQKMQLRYNVLVFWIWSQRDVLSLRLDNRVDSMVEQGLMSEIKQMYSVYDSVNSNHGIWQVLGFKQFLNYLADPSPENWQEGLANMKVETRHYAKKQTKWIRNKLGPLMNDLGGHMALVDATDLSDWHHTVKDRGIAIAQQWLANKPLTALVPEHLECEVLRKRQAYSPEQWVRHRCDLCSVVKETVLMGDEEWRIHLRSKNHRFHMQRVARENGLHKAMSESRTSEF